MLSERDQLLLTAAASFVVGSAVVLAALRDTNSPAAQKAKQLWLSTQKEKRWAETFFLKYSGVWISWMAVIVLSKVWMNYGPWDYMSTGLVIALPCFLYPFFYEPEELRVGPMTSRYWFKANVWVAIFSYVGNYFWTHYFYTLLGASYTFKAHRINDVPISMFLFTHAYFCTYHTATTAALRRWWTSRTYASVPGWAASLGTAALVFLMAYCTALTEALTISGFPYYAIQDREFFYTVGSMCYGIYFLVSFPMYARMDEVDCDGPQQAVVSTGTAKGQGKATPAKGRRKSVTAASVATVDLASPTASVSSPSAPAHARWSLSRATIDSLAASMAVTILLDLWRLGYAWLVKGQVAPGMLPWVPA